MSESKDPWAVEVSDDDLNRRRHERFTVDLPAEITGDGEEDQAGTLHDISESGAAVLTDQLGFTNEQFVELHVEGYGSYGGRVVRQFKGGYALEFERDQREEKRMKEEMEKFRTAARKPGALEG